MGDAKLQADERSRPPIRDRLGLSWLGGRVGDSLEKHFWRWAALFTILFFICSIVRNLRVTLWFDELMTLYVAKLATVEAILGINDASPPLYPLIVHWLLAIIGNEALAVRLPATLGYCAMMICLWEFCRSRLPAAFAFAVPLLTFERALFFATEGRGYGLVLGCAAAALLCWQRAADGHRRGSAIALLALCSALMVALHYYAIFFLAALFLAEVVRWRTIGRIDFAVATALVPGALVLGLHYALLVAGQDYGTYFWSQPSFRSIVTLYERFLLPPLIFGALAFVAAAVLPRSSPGPRENATTFQLHEWTVIAALIAMPLVVIVVSMFTTQAFVERYVLWAVIGFSLLLAACLSAAVRGRAAVGVMLIAVATAATVRLEIGPLVETPVLRTNETVRQELEKFAQGGLEPIVIANGHVFMELFHYLSPPLRERLIHPLSRELEVQYRGYDTDALILASLAEPARIPVRAYDDALRDHKSFLLAAIEGDYLPQHLTAQGYSVTRLQDATTLYQVEAPNA